MEDKLNSLSFIFNKEGKIIMEQKIPDGFKKSKTLDIIQKTVVAWLDEKYERLEKENDNFTLGEINALEDLACVLNQLEGSERFDYIHSQNLQTI